MNDLSQVPQYAYIVHGIDHFKQTQNQGSSLVELLDRF